MAIDVDDCFVRLSVDATALSVWVRSLIQSDDLWDFTMSTYPAFSVGPLPLDTCFEKCPELNQINNIATIHSISVLKMLPHSIAETHIDSHRGVAINMLVLDENNNSVTNESSSVSVFVNKETRETLKNNFQPNTLYLFNTHMPHCVINHDGHRHMLSVTFDLKPNLLPFRALKKFLKATHYIL